MYSGVSCPVLIVPAWRTPRDRREASFMLMKRRALPIALSSLKRVELLEMHDTIHDIPIQRPADLVAAVKEFFVRNPPSTAVHG